MPLIEYLYLSMAFYRNTPLQLSNYIIQLE